MINVWIPAQKEFEKYRAECKKLYEKVQNKICDPNSFEFICNNTLFYLFENKGQLIGAIYYFVDEENKLCNFDLVISFDEQQPEQVEENVKKAIEDQFPEYTFIVTLDNDFSLS